jgi:hypothetical protein
MKFMALYMAPASAIEQLSKASPEETKAGMDEWNRWAKSNEKTIVDLGMPLGKTKRVTSAGTSDTKNEITGYSIVEGDSPDTVAKMFKGHPHLKITGASIDFLEFFAIPGMDGR